MPDIEHSGSLILWGYNPSFTRLTHATATVAALKRGMRLIVIDPRRVGLAGKADLWLRVRPGTDGALALGLAHLMIERGWYDRDFIRDWSNGPHLVRADTGRLLTERDLDADGDARQLLAWDARDGTAGAVRHHDGPLRRGQRRASRWTGEYRIATLDGEVVCHPAFELYAQTLPEVPAGDRRGDLLDTARPGRGSRAADLARAPGVLLRLERPRAPRQHHADGARDVAALCAHRLFRRSPAATCCSPAPPTAPITGEELPAAERMAPTLGLAERPLGPARWGYVGTRDLYRAILEGAPYPVRALIGFGSNMLLAHADGGHGREALAALDFYAHADLFMNPTAEMADVVLPVASSFEREALKIGFEVSQEAQSLIQLRPAVVPPPGEARPDTDIVFDLAARLGLGDAVLERRHRGCLSPPTRADRRHAGAVARRARRRARAVADPPCQACRAGRERHAARLRHAFAQDRALFANLPGSRLRAVARFRGAADRSGSAARPCGALPADPDQREVDGVLPDPAPRAAKSAQARPGSRSGAASRRRRRRAASPTATG